ncbi:hypothetical protein GCM10015536_22500 [Streptomyces griseomycini]|nr:hypothetical protein GCM10015536_22500 [Streptomyces griseomycini]
MRKTLGERRGVGVLDPDPAGEPAEAGERIGVQDEQCGDGHGPPCLRDGRVSSRSVPGVFRESEMRGSPTLAPGPASVNTGAPPIRCVPVSPREAGADVDVSFLGGPGPQRGAGAVAPFGFALDRELRRRVPDEVPLHLTRTP